ncbi:putative bifunctional diguanylate cyclase/phosphodiesterase [Pseudonocardia humida]|uniref:EAL domain-containing protein n=1 Tax=Pseudonocardia humida TaxID=2800819 RepID=A0ABT0ZSH2_9PSEU|nr:EAL domain-containing protein [Pseudonocardia humida]MCO1653682.1 EAL domain-containing protein [Pseudonocardia humida]
MTTRSPTALGPARVAAILVGSVAALLGPAAGLLLEGPALDAVVDLALLLFSTTAALLCLRAARLASGRTRHGWAAIALGCAAWAVSQALWSASTAALGATPPHPSPVELGFMAFPVAAVVGLRWITEPAAAEGGSALRRALDRLMIACALALVTWVTVLDTVVDASTGEVLVDGLALYYPLADVVLVTAAVITVARLRHDIARHLLLGGGLVLMAVTDHVFAHELAVGSPRGTTAFAWGWWIAFAMVGAAALVPGSGRPPAGARRAETLRVLNQLAPHVPLAAAAVLAAVDLVVAVEDDAVAGFLLAALVLLVLVRQYAMLRENLALDAAVRLREEQLRHQALHDPLTGLPNRAMFLDRLARALDLARREGRAVSVAFLDLDGFKAVNDALGHAAGDALLVRVAERLRGAVRRTDALARLGGDEFAVLVEDGDPARAAAGLVEALRTPFALAERTVAVSTSVGVATAEPDGPDDLRAPNLLHRADVAMYAAKTAGRGRVRVHSPALDLARRDDRPPLERAFARALSAGEVRADFQPVVDPVTGRIAALEALARWTHDGVDVPPATFIPICARAGLHHQLTAAVLEQSCARLAGWNAALGHRRLRVAVNVDPTEFSDPALVERVVGLLERHRLAPAQLALEMTEIAFGNRPDTVLEVIHRLRGLGVRLALDDFGTGYSTLARLLATPVDTVKIDRVFVTDVDHDDRQRAFLAALLELARALGMRTVAEGVERPGQLRELRALRCDLVQGHFIARPADAATTTGLLLAGRPLLGPELLDPTPSPA